MNSAERVVVVGSIAWATVILMISVATFGNVNSDARLIVGVAVVLSTGAALAASWWGSRSHLGLAAGGLLVSVVAPTYFLWVVNAVPLILASVAIVAATRSRREAVAAS